MEQKPFFRALLETLTRERKAKGIDRLDSLASSFSITEKVLFLVCFLVFAGAALSLLGKVSDSFSVTVPERGGSLVEGIVGTPRFVNPLLAVSDADRDLTELVYSGLLKAQPDGSYIPDLAESYSVSPDGLSYSFTIRANAQWSDGSPVTADDVEFTVVKAQDPALKSPRFVNWQGVTVEKTGTKSIIFHLKQPYAPFISNLTLGIMPSHLWKNLSADQIPFSSLNTNAVGSGPFVISSVVKSADGIPTEFVLKPNSTYALGEPFIGTLYIKSFGSEQALLGALESGQVESASNLSPASAEALRALSRTTVLAAPLTRIFGVFFNQNQDEVLAHKEVRQALDMITDKQGLIQSVLGGYGSVADGPLPSESSGDASSSNAYDASTTDAAATKILTKAGWKIDPTTNLYVMVKGKGKTAATTTLELNLSTANVPELVLAAKKLQETWTAFGIKTDVQVYEPSDLNQSVIRPRKYDALLFGLVTGRNSDLYPFWHSSQRNDPGLNISLYTNRKADDLLEKMRIATSSTALNSEYALFENEVGNDVPAVFLWSPDFLYAIPAKLHGVELGQMTTSSDRFLGIEKWYINTDRVWNTFVKDQNSIINQ
ncbi:MAG TPA: peptide ABC transporter substrate-binding protein [Candidatus Paceibacterota bacterium]|nr:peptide ABC transporter substrate-binding protein [Candidatus Paceibacterota bacterium]